MEVRKEYSEIKYIIFLQQNMVCVMTQIYKFLLLYRY